MEKKELVKFVDDLDKFVRHDRQSNAVLSLCFVLFADYVELAKLGNTNLLVNHMEDKLSMFIKKQLMDFPVLAPVAKESEEKIASVSRALALIFLEGRLYHKKGFRFTNGRKLIPSYDL